MIKLSITTEWWFFTIYWIWFFIHQNFLKKEEEEEREYVLNEHFNWTIECNWIDLRMHRMCGRFFNKDDRFNIVLEWEYSIDDIYSISALLWQIIDRSRAVKFFTNNNNKDIWEI
jgi:hypothetical protein